MSDAQTIVLYKKKVNLTINNHGQAISKSRVSEIKESFLSEFSQFQLGADVEIVLASSSIKGAYFVFGGAIIVANISLVSGDDIRSISVIPSVFQKDESSFISLIISLIKAILTVMERIDPTSENMRKLEKGVGDISGADPKTMVEDLLREISGNK